MFAIDGIRLQLKSDIGQDQSIAKWYLRTIPKKMRLRAILMLMMENSRRQEALIDKLESGLKNSALDIENLNKRLANRKAKKES